MSDIPDQVYRQVLVVRSQAGDHAAFEELIALYQPRLYYFLRKMLPDPQRAEDVLQDVWLDVFRGMARLTRPAAFPAWLYRIARDRVFRILRQRRPSLCSLDGLDLPDETTGADEWSAEDAAEVHTALDQLRPDHREVLLLRFMEEMSYEDIARVTGCPLGTVRSRLHHAKRALRSVLTRRTS